jgi:hypothetical protein
VLPRVRNFNVAVAEEVARLFSCTEFCRGRRPLLRRARRAAGRPPRPVVLRAQELSRAEAARDGKGLAHRQAPAAQMSLFARDDTLLRKSPNWMSTR